MFLGQQCKLGVIQEYAFQGTFLVIPAILNDAGEFADILKMTADIAFAHDQAIATDMGQIIRRKILLPVKGNIAALHDEVLMIFNGSFDYFPNDGPEIIG